LQKYLPNLKVRHTPNGSKNQKSMYENVFYNSLLHPVTVLEYLFWGKKVQNLFYPFEEESHVKQETLNHVILFARHA
jgi:hypothetical protein